MTTPTTTLPTTVANYTSQLNSLQSSFSSLMENFYNTYIIHHTNPDDENYSNTYKQEKSQLTTFFSSIFTLKNNIQTSIHNLNQQIAELDNQLQREEVSNVIVQNKLDQKRWKQQGAHDLIKESYKYYQYQYVSNASLIVGNFILLYVIYYYYRK